MSSTEQFEHAPETQESQGASQLQALLQIGWRRKGLIAFGVVVAVVIGAIYYSQCVPVYQSGAQLLVVKKRPDALPVSSLDTRYSSMSFSDDYLATHMVLMRSPLIVGRAVQKRDLANLPSFKGIGDPTGVIPQALTVTRDTKETGASASNILYLSYHAPVPEDCPAVLNAIVDSYREFLDEAYRSMSNETVELITQAKNYLRKDLKDKEEAYRQFRQSAPVVWKGKNGGHGEHERLASIEHRRATLLVRRTEVEARLATIDEALKSGRSPAALRALVADMTKRSVAEQPTARTASPTNKIEESLLPLLLQEQTLLEDYGADHPQVVSIRQRIAFTRKFLNELADVPEDQTDALKEEAAKLRDPVNRFRLVLLQELEEIKAEENRLAEVLKQEQEQVKALMQYELEEETLRTDVARTQALYDSIIKRLQEIDLGKEGGGFEARMISPPGIGGRIAPKAVPIFAGAIVAGLLIGCTLAYLAEFFDKSFRSPDEIRRRLGVPLIGHIPIITPAANAATSGAGLDPMLITYYRPRTVEAEAYRGVRTSLYFSTRGQRHKVIQVTSASQGDGKSTLAANLAVSIAQSGQRVLLIDADLRRPRAHLLLNLNNERGLVDAVNGESDWKDLVQTTACQNLFALGSGPLPRNPSELLTAVRFQELIQSVREAYDFVIVDTPPLLAVTDPCVVAPRVDGVILALRLSKLSRPQAERAKDILQNLGARVIGVVVNGLSRKPGQSAYGYTQDSYHFSSDYVADSTSDYDLASYYHPDNDLSAANGTHEKPDEAAKPEGDKSLVDRLLNR